MTRIESIHAVAFRGLRDDRVALGGGSLVLYGENGTGKSSLVDALEFFCGGTVSHLEGVQTTSSKKHAPHVQCKPGALAVSVAFKGYAAPLVRTLTESPKVPAGLSDVVARLSASKFILRRAQLLAFIMAQDAPRYQQLAGLIGADELDTVELAWKDAVTTAEETIASAAQSLNTYLSQLTAACGPITAATEPAILQTLNKYLATLGEPPLAAIRDGEDRKASVIAASGHKERAEAATRYKGIEAQAQRVHAACGGLAELGTFHDSVLALQAEVEHVRQSRLSALYRSAKDLIARYELDTCPVCGRPIDRQTLLETLTQRILQGESVATRVNQLTKARNAIRASLHDFGEMVKALRVTLGGAPGLGADGALWDDTEKWVALCGSRLDGEVHAVELGSRDTFVAAVLLGAVATACTAVVEKAGTRIAELAGTADDARIVAVLDVLTRVGVATAPALAAAMALSEARAQENVLNAGYRALVESKKVQVQGIYDALEKDITRYYQAIHPAEPHGAVTLEVSATKRGSAAIRTAFADREGVDPRAYNSEAHLDSLGLCVFLAFVKRFNDGLPLLVLDDVVSSVDAAHRTRICRLVFTEFPTHQLLITTHDALWFEEILSNARALKFQPLRAMRILGWTLEDGPTWADYVPRWDEMRAKAKADDKQGAGSLARHTLEGYLFQLAINLQAPIILRPDARYDVGALLDPVLNRARKLLPGFEDQNQDTLARFHASSLLGNLLTHNNPIAAGTSKQEVIDFADSVADLYGLFFCPKCDQLIRYYRDAKVVKCACAAGGKQWSVK